MQLLHALILLLFIAATLGWAAQRARLPYPIALVLGGGLLALVPGLPALPIDPDLILYIVLPPLLYRAALTTSWRDFRANLGEISLLALGLVAVTTLAVGCVVKWLVPGMPWAVAFALGAIVSPTDAGATSAMLAGMRLPRRTVALTGAFSITEAAIDFVRLSLGGIALGVAIGAL